MLSVLTRERHSPLKPVVVTLNALFTLKVYSIDMW